MAVRTAGQVLRDFLSQITTLAQTRLELFGLESLDLGDRLLGRLAMLLAAMVFLLLALLVATVAFALYVWPYEYRYTALGILALLYALLGGICTARLWYCLRRDPPPFSATLAVLREDAWALGKHTGESDGAAAGDNFSADMSPVRPPEAP